MSGIYIHIPFCRQACHYCDFHFSTQLKNKEAFLSALHKEIGLRKNYLNPFETALPESHGMRSVYFGGGTPSLLSYREIMDIFDELGKFFTIEKNAEITLEANPDDLPKDKLDELRSTPVNRLSIGIQSFSDADLQFMNRAHTADEAIRSVNLARDTGFENISIDLIYGMPTLSNEQWYKNLTTAFSLGVPHISAYCLTVEPQTALASFIKKGKAKNVDDEKAAQQFEILMDEMGKQNFLQYEISNFCKSTMGNWEGQHNSSYWHGEPYLGLGPSAHSYNGNSRQWNISNNNIYINALAKNELNFEREILSEKDKYNEYILTSLRTIRGCNLKTVADNFGKKLVNHVLKNIQPYILQNEIQLSGHILTLTKNGKFISDKIVRDLFV